MSFGLYLAVLIGTTYIALEPFARRLWLELLISRNRLLAGDFRDPLVGRDILVGGVFGFGGSLLVNFQRCKPGENGLHPGLHLFGGRLPEGG